jgi:ATP-dependent exoDNAse (exonuclease V) beta subunit
MSTIPDAQERLACLDIRDSFIVQAPAGSGKTELLTQRFLRLLAAVNHPENIVAITFTRKAAGEMRERIIHALQKAQNEPEPDAAHAKQTWRLAKAALSHNDKQSWQLLQNPNRLRILTLDSLALMLSQQMPITSCFGAKPDITEDASRFYETAVERFITREHDTELNARIDRLLLNFDNQAEQVKRMLVGLLAKREQWLSHIIPFLNDDTQLKQHLELTLQAINQDIMEQLLLAWPEASLEEWQCLLLFSLENQADSTTEYPGTLSNNLDHLPAWKSLADLILTKQNTVRKTLTKRQGFPSKTGVDKAEKERRAHFKDRALTALQAMSEDDNLILALTTLKNAPPLQFDEKTWQSLSDLVALLPWLVAELNVIFQRTGQVDFNELTLGALRALGNSDQPTELAMKLDHQILHLLIDEFQDTSILQGELIQKMIIEWQPGDGRTLFIVGDPMQSIYRFRNAEVSLFLQAQQNGIGHIPLRAIRLCANFRSQAPLIDWVNPTFQTIFPQTPQPSIGGVPYSEAVAARSDNPSAAGVQLNPAQASTQAEADNLTEQIQQLRQQHPTDSIAVLVRTRHQLRNLLANLQMAGIAVKATEIDYLGERREIQDLLVLTQALLHLGDRTAWLALLRTPCFGFTLADCLAVAEAAQGQAIWPALQNAPLSEEAQARLSLQLPILTHALKHIRRCSLSNWVCQTWQALGGKQSMRSDNELNNARRFFDCLAEHEDDYSNERFERALQKLFAEDQNTADNPVEVMTIHKSKGLEFDHVILPNINYGKPPQSSELMLWSTMSFADGSSGLLLGILPNKKTDCGIYQYLRYVQAQQLDQETSRVFYVASTRAKQSLQLSTVNSPVARKNTGSLHSSSRRAQSAHPGSSQVTDPASSAGRQVGKSGSFLQKLPLAMRNELGDADSTQSEQTDLLLRANCQRIPLATLQAMTRPSELPQIGANDSVSLQLPIIASIIGTVTHAYLHDLSQQQTWDNQRLTLELVKAGLPKRLLAGSAQSIQSQIDAMLKDPQALWILSDQHQEAHSEYCLSEMTKKGIRKHIIDRTFIADGTRWIIDYKTSTPTGTSMEAFIQAELEHYAPQLKRYEKLFAYQPEPVKSGLYFTALQQWAKLDNILHT